jgi:hypothetical protein
MALYVIYNVYLLVYVFPGYYIILVCLIVSIRIPLGPIVHQIVLRSKQVIVMRWQLPRHP